MPTSQLLVLDTKCDRTEVRTLLDKLPPRERVAFLNWACGQAAGRQNGSLPEPVSFGYGEVVKAAYRCDEADARLTRMVYMDILHLFTSYSLDADATARALEQRARAVRRR